jgi:AcrR family transcriptional regulator
VNVRQYRLGKRQPGVDRTRSSILSAARRLIAEHGPQSSLGDVAALAGVSRITVYNQFGSKAGLVKALAAEARPVGVGTPHLEPGLDPRDQLRRRITEACTTWAGDPGLYRQLHGHQVWRDEEPDVDRLLAESLAAADQLRAGCSIKEAEDVIGILTSFAAFDRLHKGGRRSASAVAEILMRLSSELLNQARDAA